MDDLSIVILAYDCSPSIATCLESVLSCRCAERAEIICVLNGSRDDSLTQVNSYIVQKEDMIVLDGPYIEGADAVYRGVERASGDKILVMSGKEQLTDRMLGAAQGTWLSGRRTYCTRGAQCRKRDAVRSVNRITAAIARRVRR